MTPEKWKYGTILRGRTGIMLMFVNWMDPIAVKLGIGAMDQRFRATVLTDPTGSRLAAGTRLITTITSSGESWLLVPG